MALENKVKSPIFESLLILENYRPPYLFCFASEDQNVCTKNAIKKELFWKRMFLYQFFYSTFKMC